MQLRSLFLALGLTVVSCAPTSNQIAQRYNSFNPERAINHSQTIIDSVHDGNPAMDADDKEQEREFFGHGIDSFQELVADAQTMLESGLASSEYVHRMVVELIAWQYFFTPYNVSLPPTPLVESWDQIVAPPEGVHPFYKKYMNVYVDDYRHGSPIITSGEVPDAAI